MPILLLLGLGVGAYLLLSSRGSAAPQQQPGGGGYPVVPYQGPQWNQNPNDPTGGGYIQPNLLSYNSQAEAQAANPGATIVPADDGSGRWGVLGNYGFSGQSPPSTPSG